MWNSGGFIPVSTGEKNVKNRPRNARVIVEIKVAPFLFGHCVVFINVESIDLHMSIPRYKLTYLSIQFV